MDLYHTTDVDGVSILNPNIEAMRELLATLDSPDANTEELPDVSLVHDPSGWAILAYPSGIVTFENLDDGDIAPRFMRDVSRDECLQLWQQLARGKINALKQLPWETQKA